MKKILLILIAATFILSSFIGCKSQETIIDVENIADIQLKGINGKGIVSVIVDKEKYDDVVNAYRAGNKDPDKVYNFLKAIETLKYKVVSEGNNLSNGDEVSIVAIYDEALFSNAKIKVENAEFTYIVSGLDEPIMIDPFAEIELVYEGASPKASVQVRNISKDQYISTIEYRIEPNNFLSIGDKIVVTAWLDADKAEESDYLVPDILTKEFNVENIDVYVENLSEIDDINKNKIEDKGKERIKSELESGIYLLNDLGLREAEFNELEITLVSICFYDNKDAYSFFNNTNRLFYIYKISALPKNETEYRTTYVSVDFREIIKGKDNTIDTEYDLSGGIGAINKNLDKVKESITNYGDYEIQEIMP